MGCEHTVRKLLEASSFATAGETVRRARNDAERAELQNVQEQHRVRMQGLQQVQAIIGNSPGVPLLNAGMTALPMVSDAQAAIPTECGVFFDSLKHNVVRQYGLYEHHHHIVLNALFRVLGNLPMGPGATPVDALTFAMYFGFVYTMVSKTDRLPDFSACAGGEDLNTLVAQAAHFVLMSEEAASASAQTVAKNPELLRHAVVFLKLVAFQKRPSALVMDVAVSLAISVLFGTLSHEERKLIVTLQPLAHYLPYVTAARACSTQPKNDQDSHVITMMPDGRVVADGVVYTFVGFSQRGVMLSVDGSDENGEAVTNRDDYQQFGVDFKMPFVCVKPSSRLRAQSVCAACQIPMRPFHQSNFLRSMQSPLVTSDLSTACDVHVNEDGVAKFKADALLWDDRLEKTVRMQGLHFEADVFDLHALMPLANESLSALVPCPDLCSTDRFQAPFPVCNDVRATGLAVVTLLACAEDYSVDQCGRVSTVTIAGHTLFAARDGKKRMWRSRGPANHAVTLGDVV